MTRSNHLDEIRVASPCPADWNAMQGDERRRFCSQCKLHVYNLSAMTRDEASALVAGKSEKDARLCVRFYRRTDGTVLTQDCPVGLRGKLRAARVRAVALAGALFSLLVGCVRKPDPTAPQPQVEQLPVLQGEVCVPDAPTMGDIVAPPTGQDPAHVMGRIAPNLPEKRDGSDKK